MRPTYIRFFTKLVKIILQLLPLTYLVVMFFHLTGVWARAVEGLILEIPSRLGSGKRALVSMNGCFITQGLEALLWQYRHRGNMWLPWAANERVCGCMALRVDVIILPYLAGRRLLSRPTNSILPQPMRS